MNDSILSVGRPAWRKAERFAKRLATAPLPNLAEKQDDELVTRLEAAIWTNLCEHTLQRMARPRKRRDGSEDPPVLTPIRINARVIRYRVGDIRNLLRAGGANKT